MPPDLDSDYFARRAARERAVAERAADACVRNAHLQLAELCVAQSDRHRQLEAGQSR